MAFRGTSTWHSGEEDDDDQMFPILTIANATPYYLDVQVTHVMQSIDTSTDIDCNNNGSTIVDKSSLSRGEGHQIIPPASTGHFFSHHNSEVYIKVNELHYDLDGYVMIVDNARWINNGSLIIANRRLIESISRDQCWTDQLGQNWIAEQLPRWLQLDNDDVLHSVLEHLKYEKNLNCKKRMRKVIEHSSKFEELNRHPTLKWILQEALENLSDIFEDFDQMDQQITDIETKFSSILTDLRTEKGRTERWIKAYSKYFSNMIQQDKQKLLLDSSKNGQIEDVMALIEVGTYVNCIDKNGFTPLHWAALNGHADIAQVLLSASAFENSKTQYETIETRMNITIVPDSSPLHLAAYNGHDAIVSLLIRFECDVDARDRFNRTPLHLTCLKGHLNSTSLLLQMGKASTSFRDCNFGSTPLHLACWKGHYNITELLLKAGADVNVVDYCMWSPLRWATSGSYKKIEEMLMRFGSEDF